MNAIHSDISVVMEALLRLNWQTFRDAMKDDQEVRSLEQVVSTATMEVQKDLGTCTIQRLYDASELEKLHTKFNKYNESTTKDGQILAFIRRDGQSSTAFNERRGLEFAPPVHSGYDSLDVCVGLHQLFKIPSSALVGHDVAGRKTPCRTGSLSNWRVRSSTKTNGGIIGFSLNKGAVQRWLLTSHERAAITQACREMAGLPITDSDEVIKEMGKATMIADERDVKKVQTTLNSWVKPFKQSDDDEIYHLASGLTASEKIEKVLLIAHEQCK